MGFTASAAIIAMTMSVFEFSEPGSDRNRGTHLGLHGTYQTSHGRVGPTPLPDFDIAAFISNNSEQF